MRVIAAISTAPGIGGIGIVRMSGKKCFEILDKIFKTNSEKEVKGYTLKYGHIINPKNGKIIDEVLVSYFVSPKSYTTENMCEINSHGSNVVMKKILELCLENGAYLAEPGEFTKKAFLNGRIDLSQAEAVIDLINSKTEKESESSIRQLDGSLSKEINSIKSMVLDILTDIEASIDYPEYDIEEVGNERILNSLSNIISNLDKLINSFNSGRIIRDGIKTAIIGKPNVGKSSLLNAVLKEERAIVTEYEGTTRDTIEEFVSINGIPLKIIDTAGIRNAIDEVEKIGIKKSIDVVKTSDLNLVILDVSRDLEKEDIDILELTKDKNTIIILNKIDINSENISFKSQLEKYNKPIIEISALEKKGIENLYEEIYKMFNLNEINFEASTIVTNVRHLDLLKKAKMNAEKAIETIDNNMPVDITSINIKEIIDSLNAIIGENTSDDIINEIFKKFCLGK